MIISKIALLIPHYNNPEGLTKSISSIHQDEHIDVLIIDDGSTIFPNETAVRSSFKAKGNIMFFYSDVNEGIEAALNRGLNFVMDNLNYKYIARLDCGDLCLGPRFKIQQEFLEQHPKVQLVGSNARAVDVKGKFLYNLTRPESSRTIRQLMYFNCMFVHPSVMFQRKMLEIFGNYPTNYKSAEDYAYFFQFVRQYEVANINQFLVQIEINPAGISLTRRKEQVKNRIKIILKNFYPGFFPIFGLLRSMALYVVPPQVLLYLKTKFLK